jgi:hypothetical protein
VNGQVLAGRDGRGFATGLRATRIDQLLIFDGWGIVTGTGTIDGTGEYQFLLAALQGNHEGDAGAFRLRIWHDDFTVYDTQPGDHDVAMPTTHPTGGSIKID